MVWNRQSSGSSKAQAETMLIRGPGQLSISAFLARLIRTGAWRYRIFIIRSIFQDAFLSVWFGFLGELSSIWKVKRNKKQAKPYAERTLYCEECADAHRAAIIIYILVISLNIYKYRIYKYRIFWIKCHFNCSHISIDFNFIAI